MEAIEYARIIRRRWHVVALAVVAALAAALLTGVAGDLWPSDPRTGISGPQPTFSATHLLGVEDPDELASLLILAQSQEVLSQTVERLGIPLAEGEAPPDGLVVLEPDDRGLIKVTATDRDGDAAVRIADAYAAEAIVYVGEHLEHRGQEQAVTLAASLVEQQAVLRELEERLSTLPEDSIETRLTQADRDAASSVYASLQNRLAQLRFEAAAAPLYTLSSAVPVPAAVDDEGALAGPADERMRLAILFATALGLGLGLALVVERVDTRIHTRTDAEHAFGLPVVAEIPRVVNRRWHGRRGAGSPMAYEEELTGAYGRLRVALLHMPRWLLAPRLAAQDRTGADPGGSSMAGAVPTRVVVVTSSTRGEGRSSVAVNLAVSLAAAGKQVAIMDCDHQNPTLLDRVGLEVDLTATGSGWALYDAPQLGVKIGAPGRDSGPGDRAASAPGAIEAVLGRVDVAVIDTGPLLSTIDAASLVPNADAVVLVVRRGAVTRDEAGEVRDLLANLHAAVSGIAFVGGPGRAKVSRHGSRSAQPRGRPETAATLELADAPDGHRDGAGTGDQDVAVSQGVS